MELKDLDSKTFLFEVFSELDNPDGFSSEILNHWGLEVNPFSLTSTKGDFFYVSEQYKEVLAEVVATCNMRQGMSLVIGDIGMGKTTMAKTSMPYLANSPNINVSYFEVKKDSTPFSFLGDILDQFDVSRPRTSTIEYFNTLQSFIKHEREQDKAVILIIDDAQNLNPETIETLRLLANTEESDDGKSIQTIIYGQPDTIQVLQQVPNFESRIATFQVLERFTEQETIKHIRFRVKEAGGDPDKIFTPEALSTIHRYSLGVPRQAVKIGFNCLIKGYQKRLSRIDEEFITGNRKSYELEQLRESIRQKIDKELEPQILNENTGE